MTIRAFGFFPKKKARLFRFQRVSFFNTYPQEKRKLKNTQKGIKIKKLKIFKKNILIIKNVVFSICYSNCLILRQFNKILRKA